MAIWLECRLVWAIMRRDLQQNLQIGRFSRCGLSCRYMLISERSEIRKTQQIKALSKVNPMLSSQHITNVSR